MQRQNNNTVVCLVAVFIVIAAAVAILLLRDTNNNPTTSDSSSTGSAIQQFNTNNSSLLLDHNTSITFPWTLTVAGGSSNKTNTKESAHHDGPISNFISITDTARGRDITPIKSTRSSNKCTDNNKSLMRFTLITDNYPVRFVCNFVHMI